MSDDDYPPKSQCKTIECYLFLLCIVVEENRTIMMIHNACNYLVCGKVSACRCSASLMVQMSQVLSHECNNTLGRYTRETVLSELFIFFSGGLKPVSMFFTTLYAEPSVSPHEFILTCRSVGGPATSVIWTRNRSPVTEDSNHTISQIIVNTSATPVYHNRLQVKGREGGNYRCNVASNRKDFIHDSLSRPVAGSLTVQGQFYIYESVNMYVNILFCSCWGTHQPNCCPAVRHEY